MPVIIVSRLRIKLVIFLGSSDLSPLLLLFRRWATRLRASGFLHLLAGSLLLVVVWNDWVLH